MSIPFDSRAFICTSLVMLAFAGLANERVRSTVLYFGGYQQEGSTRDGGSALTKRDDRQEIIGAMLNYEARRADRPSVCLNLMSRGAAFDWQRERIAFWEREGRDNPASREATNRQLEALISGRRRWLQVTRTPPQVLDEGPLLAEEDAASFRRAEVTLMTAQRGDLPRIGLGRDGVPAPLQSSDPACGRLTYTAPEINGEIAFIATFYECGSLCGEGWLFGLRRYETGWVLEGASGLWIS